MVLDAASGGASLVLVCTLISATSRPALGAMVMVSVMLRLTVALVLGSRTFASTSRSAEPNFSYTAPFIRASSLSIGW